jgi:hypothetical protein
MQLKLPNYLNPNLIKIVNTKPINSLTIAAIALVSLLSCFQTAEATQLFTDRATFEAALATYSIDGQENNATGFQFQQVRPDYVHTGSNYGSINHSGTSNNSSRGMDAGGYIWTYAPGPHTFTFDAPITAFGFDYAQYIGSNAPLVFDIDGNANPTPGVMGFLGVIYDAPTTVAVLNTQNDYLLYDNVTYGLDSGASVPVGGSTALMMGIAILGCGAVKRKLR